MLKLRENVKKILSTIIEIVITIIICIPPLFVAYIINRNAAIIVGIIIFIIILYVWIKYDREGKRK